MTKTEQIFELTCPYSNPYQGMARRVLFVCSVGLLRSPAAAEIGFSEFGWNTRSCGSDLKCALIPLSANLVAWADDIVFMKGENFHEAVILFSHTEYAEEIREKSRILNINDDFDRDDIRLRSRISDELKLLSIPDATDIFSPD